MGRNQGIQRARSANFALPQPSGKPGALNGSVFASAQLMVMQSLCQKSLFPEVPPNLPNPILTVFWILPFPLQQSFLVRAATEFRNCSPQRGETGEKKSVCWWQQVRWGICQLADLSCPCCSTIPIFRLYFFYVSDWALFQTDLTWGWRLKNKDKATQCKMWPGFSSGNTLQKWL